MLGLIDLTGALVTGDVLHYQGESAGLIKDRGGDWLFTLKANRPVQYAEARCAVSHRPRNGPGIASNVSTPIPVRRRKISLRRNRTAENGLGRG